MDEKKFPDELCSFVRHCLEWEPKDRWSAKKLLEMKWFEGPMRDLKDFLKGKCGFEKETPKADQYCRRIGDWIRESKVPELRFSQIKAIVESGHVRELAPKLHLDDADLKQSLSNMLSDSHSSLKLSPMSTARRRAATMPTPDEHTRASYRGSSRITPSDPSRHSCDFT